MKKTFLILICIMTVGCSTQRHFTSDKGRYEYKQSSKTTEDSTFFLSGIGQKDTINAKAICGAEENVNAVETKLAPLNIIMGIITLGIYTPLEYTVYCKR